MRANGEGHVRAHGAGAHRRLPWDTLRRGVDGPVGGAERHRRCFSQPSAIAYKRDPAGAHPPMVLVADSGNNRVVVLPPDGPWVRSLAGEGGGADRFDCPCDVAVAGDSYVYVADKGNRRIVRLDAACTGFHSSFYTDFPVSSVAASDGGTPRLFASDTDAVRELCPDTGDVVLLYRGSSGLHGAGFGFIVGLVMLEEKEELVVSDAEKQAVVVLSTQRALLSWKGIVPVGFPIGRPLVVASTGCVVVCGRDRVLAVDTDVGGSCEQEIEDVGNMRGCCWIPEQQQLWVCDSRRGLVHRLDAHVGGK